LGCVIVFSFASGLAQDLSAGMAGAASPEPQAAGQPGLTTLAGGQTAQNGSRLEQRLAAIQDEIASSQANVDQAATDSENATR
jgi:hypothetical protein